MAHKAIFLDRDDTLIEDPGYINDPEAVKLLPGVTETLAGLRKMGYKLVVVTNQSAVARGIVSEDVLDEIHERLEVLLSRQGVYLDGIFYCPYHPEGVIPKYRRESEFRKPNPGMLLEAAQDMNIDLEQSWMIGNSYSDVAAGHSAGCRTILVSSSANPARKEKGDPDPDKIAVNIKEAVNIVKMFQRKGRVVRPSQRKDQKVEAKAKAAAVKDERVDEVADVGASVVVQEEVKKESVAARVEEVKRAVVKGKATKAEAVVEEKAVAEPEAGEVAEEVVEREEVVAAVEDAVEAVEEDVPELHSRTHEVLEEVVRHLKKANRLNMYDEFSLMKVLAGVVQVLVLFFLLLSVWFLLDPTREASSVHTVLGYAGVLQLMVIAFHMMRDRR